MKKEERIEIVAVVPGYLPVRAWIDNTLEAMQAVVEGYIEMVYPWEDDAVLVCNEEGKLIGLPMNRALHDEHGFAVDMIHGTFFIARVEDDAELHSLTEDQIKHYMNLFGGAEA